MKRDFLYGGAVLYKNEYIRYRTPRPAVVAGIMYVTEDRKVEGFFETMDSARNIYSGVLGRSGSGTQLTNRVEERELGKKWIHRLNVMGAREKVKVVELSGGNQQKVVIAKSMVQDPELIIFDEPTRGVDVGAIAEIHEIIRKLADEGRAVVVISSYIPEILTLSDRILVSRQGRIVEEFTSDEADEEKIMYAAVH
jgi:simple sugar transport system ATP-binding protein